MTRAALDKKAHFLVYDFDGMKIDEQVIQAMGCRHTTGLPLRSIDQFDEFKK